MARLEDDPSHPRALLRPCLLLLLAERPGHGYDLVERLKPFGFDWGGPGPLYQTLRRLEEAGWVVSAWDASAAGPARRTYELTEEGWAVLAEFAEGLDRLSSRIDDYRARYRRVTRVGSTPAGENHGVAPGKSAKPIGASGESPRPAAAGTAGRRVIAFGRKSRRRK
ncbi:MAG TPA: PadR family transcriptional regulator [Acidimicrobiales bacterium]|nr:PadR family transcriptional regulator [Acidimicrobiales bacterium]